jgi:hypothetical protein
MLDQPRRRAGPKADKSELYEKVESLMSSQFGVDGYDPVVRAIFLAEQGFRGEELTRHELIAVHLRVAEYYHSRMRAIDITPAATDASEAKVRLLEKIREALD